MALISEWMQQCGKKVLDNAGIVRDALLAYSFPGLSSIIGAKDETRCLPPFDPKAAPEADFGPKALENPSPSVHNK